MTIILTFSTLRSMYVCLCNGHTDRDLIRAAEQGATTAGDAYAMLGKHAVCGQCLDMAQGILDAHHERGDDGLLPIIAS